MMSETQKNGLLPLLWSWQVCLLRKSPNKVDYDRLTRVVAGLERAIANLSGLNPPE